MALTKDIVADYGADPTGVANSSDAFYLGLKPDMVGQDIVDLTIPAGSYKMTGGGGQTWATGMDVLNVSATGATVFQSGAGSVELGSGHLTAVGLNDLNGKSARIRSVSAGNNTVQLTAASASSGHISRAVVGSWMMVAGYDTQGLFLSSYGWPPNFHHAEFVQITEVGSDTISFTPTLRNFYSDQWPCFNAPDTSYDAGGPATVYFLLDVWDHQTTVNGGTWTSSDLIKCEARDFTMNGGVSTDQPIFPSVNHTWRAINHDASASGLVEIDKLVHHAFFQGGSYTQIHTQSSCVYHIIFDGVTISGALNGTPRNTNVDNSTIGTNIVIGPTAYGRGETFVCRNTAITGGGVTGGVTASGPSSEGFQVCSSMANGVITIPMCYGGDAVFKLFVPDSHGRNVLFWTGTIGTIGGFQVLSVTSDTWPAADDQSSTVNITTTNGLKTIDVFSNLFTASDVGKVIVVPGAGSPTTLKTWITAVGAWDGSKQTITVYNAASASLSSSSRTLQWGTSNVYIHTNQSGGFPDVALYTQLGIRVPPARAVYFENCTGSDHILDLCQAGAQNKPLWSYTKRTYDGVTGVVSSEGPPITMHGTITSLKINVITPYTGASSLSVGLSAADNLPVVIGGAASTFIPRVNLKIAGERVITLGNTTGTQAGDTNLTMNSSVWIGRTFAAGMSRDISGESSSLWPSFTIEMITDQGFFTGQTAVAPLRLRLRAV